MDEKYRNLITNEFRSCVKETIKRMSDEETNRPFHEALLSKNVLKWSRFERSFSTSFGQKTIENISKYAALSGGASKVERQKETLCVIDINQLKAIDHNIELCRNGHPTNWNDSLQEIKTVKKSGETTSVRVISDLWWIKDGINNYLSIKTVKPNIDQTAVAKSDSLKLKIFDSECNPYFGLYYNPYGENKDDYAHHPPMTIFNMRHDHIVLIGKEYWDLLGGIGFYEELLKIAKEVGADTQEMISEYASGQSFT